MIAQTLLIGTAIVIAIVNGKGGVGKTPTAVMLAYSLARAGYKVLFCDMDQQASASLHFLGLKFARQSPTIYHVIKDLNEITPIQISPNLDLLSATADLQYLEVDLTGKKGLFWQGRLGEALKLYSGKNYNFVICDTPGSAVSIFPTMALTRADLAIVPVKTEYAAVVGTGDTLTLIEDVQGQGEDRPLNPHLHLWGIMPNQYEPRTGSHNDALKLLRDMYEKKKNIKIYEPVSNKTTLYNVASEIHTDIIETDPIKGPVLGAYWDTVAQDVITQCLSIVEARQKA